MNAGSQTKRRAGGFIAAWRTLTRLPLPGAEPGDRGTVLSWFPVVGLLLGLIAWAVAALGASLGWPEGGALAALLWLVAATGALHLDGLADTVDGLYGPWPAARALEIMKDSRVGVMGATAIVLALLLKAAAIARLATLGHLAALPVAVVTGRLSMVYLTATLNYARPSGGTGASYFKASGIPRLAGATATSLAINMLLLGGMGAALTTLGLLAAAIEGRWFQRRLAGGTGDTLGCACETVECLLLLLAAGGRSVPFA